MELKGLTIAVTGSNGFIGSHTAKLLMEHGAFVIGVDRRSGPMNSHTVRGEYNDEQIIADLELHEVDGIVHCAGTSLVGPSVMNPSLYYNNNVAKTISMLDQIRKWNNLPFVVFSSSAAVYGNPEFSFSDTNQPLTERDPKKPCNPYGRTKLMIEDILADYSKAYGIDSFSLRYFNACGAHGGLGPEKGDTHLIPQIFQAYYEKRTFKMFGDDYFTEDGTCIRDYIHVQDLARAHMVSVAALAYGHDGVDTTGASVYNLGTGIGLSNMQILNEFERLMCYTGPKKGLDWCWAPRREGDPDFLVAHGGKFCIDFDFHTEFSDLQTIMESTKEFYDKNNK